MLKWLAMKIDEKVFVTRFTALQAKSVRKKSSLCIITRFNFDLILTCKIIFESGNACYESISVKISEIRYEDLKLCGGWNLGPKKRNWSCMIGLKSCCRTTEMVVKDNPQFTM